jgi:hypothetical protein
LACAWTFSDGLPVILANKLLAALLYRNAAPSLALIRQPFPFINLQHSAASAHGLQPGQFATSYRWVAFFNMFQPLLSQLGSHGSNFCVLKRIKSTGSVANSRAIPPINPP